MPANVGLPVVVTPPPVVVIPSAPLASIPDLAVTGYKISWVRNDSGILKRMLAFQVRNTSVSEFLFSQDRFSLASFNETPHLVDASMVTVR